MSSLRPADGSTGGTTSVSMVQPTTGRRPSSSAGGGSRRRPKLPELASLPASPSRRLGGELTNVSVDPRPRLRAPVVATLRRAAAPLRSIYRFHYHPQCDANAGAQIQAAESPENLGRFNVKTAVASVIRLGGSSAKTLSSWSSVTPTIEFAKLCGATCGWGRLKAR